MTDTQTKKYKSESEAIEYRGARKHLATVYVYMFLSLNLECERFLYAAILQNSCGCSLPIR